MADDRPTSTFPAAKPSRAEQGGVSIPSTMVASLLSAVLAGGGGSIATGYSVSTEMREGMIRMEGRLDALREEVRRVADDQRAALQRMETRVAALEARLGILEREVWTAGRIKAGGQ